MELFAVLPRIRNQKNGKGFFMFVSVMSHKNTFAFLGVAIIILLELYHFLKKCQLYDCINYRTFVTVPSSASCYRQQVQSFGLNYYELLLFWGLSMFIPCPGTRIFTCSCGWFSVNVHKETPSVYFILPGKLFLLYTFFPYYAAISYLWQNQTK